MYCRKCGIELPNTANYCPECGAQVDGIILIQAEERAKEPIKWEPVPDKFVEDITDKESSSNLDFQPGSGDCDFKEDPLVGGSVRIQNASGDFASKLQESIQNPLYLIAAILFSCGFGLTFLSGCASGKGFDIFISVLGVIPNVMLGVAVWLIFASSCHEKLSDQAFKGLKLAENALIVQMVFFGVIFAFLALIGLVLLVASPQVLRLVGNAIDLSVTDFATILPALPVVGATFLFSAIVVGAIYYPYVVVHLKAISSVKNGLMCANIYRIKYAKTLLVFNSIIGGLQVFAVFEVFQGKKAALDFFTNLIVQAAVIMFSVLLYRLNKKLQNDPAKD